MFIIRLIYSALFWMSLELLTFFICLISYLPLDLALIYALVRRGLRFIFTLFFIKVKIKDFGRLPVGERSLLIANHPGLIDPLYLIAYFPKRLRFVAAANLFTVPLLGRVVKRIGSIEFSTDKKLSMVYASNILNAIKKGELVMLFPLEVRGSQGEFELSNETTQKLAAALGATIVTVSILGTDRVLPRESALLTPGQITLSVGDSRA